jgi:diguanylate cyclase (GGDEF)-like protein
MSDRRDSGFGPRVADPSAPDAYLAVVRDPRTGVFVRPYFEETLRREHAFAARHGTVLSVAMLQVDGLDRVRSEYGPKAHEVVLAGVAHRIREVLRAEDLIASWDEGTFILLLRDVDTGTAGIVAERLRRTVSGARGLVEGFPVNPTLSVGVATTHLDGGSRPSDLVTAAATNLRRAVEGGGDRVVPGFQS